MRTTRITSERIKEIGLKLLLTDKVIGVIEVERQSRLVEVLRRQIMDSMVTKLIIEGSKLIKINPPRTQRDESFRATEFILIGETISDTTKESLLGKMQYRQDKIIETMCKVNKISAWKLLWLKIRGKKIIEKRYDLENA